MNTRPISANGVLSLAASLMLIAPSAIAQDTASAPETPAPAVTAAMPSESAEACCQDCCPVCGHPRHVCKDAVIAGANCGCRGSYKFPVPPRFTYYWPGMYAQQSMTGYWSPYRYPALKLPPWMHRPEKAGGDDWRPMPQPASPQPLESPSDNNPELAPLPSGSSPNPMP